MLLSIRGIQAGLFLLMRPLLLPVYLKSLSSSLGLLMNQMILEERKIASCKFPVSVRKADHHSCSVRLTLENDQLSGDCSDVSCSDEFGSEKFHAFCRIPCITDTPTSVPTFAPSLSTSAPSVSSLAPTIFNQNAPAQPLLPQIIAVVSVLMTMLLVLILLLLREREQISILKERMRLLLNRAGASTISI